MNVDITGTLKVIEDTKLVGGFNKIKKRTCVVSTSKGYIPVDFTYEVYTAMLDGYEVGDKVRIRCIVEGRAWTKPGSDKEQYFLSLKGVSIDRVSKET